MSISRRDFCRLGIAAGLALGAEAAVPAGLSAKCKSKKIKARRVLIMTFDGIRPDGLNKAYTPNVDKLIASGAASMTTRDVMPSITLPNYTSHLCGAGPEVHGVADNGWKIDNFTLEAVERDADGYFPSVFKVLKDNVPGIKTAFYWDWKPLIGPYNPKVFDETRFSDKAGVEAYSDNADAAIEFMKKHRDEPTFVFLYTVHTDHVGHTYAWMSDEYIKSIEECDVQVGKVVDALKAEGMYDDTHILFFSDHGGVNKGHGGVSPVEMIVPWVVEGPGIKQGFTIDEPNNTVNTASTVLHLFGVDQPLCWTGEVPMSIFK